MFNWVMDSDNSFSFLGRSDLSTVSSPTSPSDAEESLAVDWVDSKQNKIRSYYHKIIPSTSRRLTNIPSSPLCRISNVHSFLIRRCPSRNFRSHVSASEKYSNGHRLFGTRSDDEKTWSYFLHLQIWWLKFQLWILHRRNRHIQSISTSFSCCDLVFVVSSTVWLQINNEIMNSASIKRKRIICEYQLKWLAHNLSVLSRRMTTRTVLFIEWCNNLISPVPRSFHIDGDSDVSNLYNFARLEHNTFAMIERNFCEKFYAIETYDFKRTCSSSSKVTAGTNGNETTGSKCAWGENGSTSSDLFYKYERMRSW